MVKDEKLIVSALQRGRYSVKKRLAFFPAEEPKLFILLGTQLLQLGEECNTQLNIIVETQEAKSHQNPPAVWMQLGDYKLVEPEDFDAE